MDDFLMDIILETCLISAAGGVLTFVLLKLIERRLSRRAGE